MVSPTRNLEALPDLQYKKEESEDYLVLLVLGCQSGDLFSSPAVPMSALWIVAHIIEFTELKFRNIKWLVQSHNTDM